MLAWEHRNKSSKVLRVCYHLDSTRYFMFHLDFSIQYQIHLLEELARICNDFLLAEYLNLALIEEISSNGRIEPVFISEEKRILNDFLISFELDIESKRSRELV